MNVIKANGDEVPFDEVKIRRSLRRVKADPDVVEIVLERVIRKMYDRITTSDLYSIVFAELKTLQRRSAGKYNLKRAIMQMGPTGYPFEKLIAALFDADGYTASTGQFIEGRCVTHEVDVVAAKGDLLYHAECKFHSFLGRVCNIKHALYAHARFVDIEKGFASEAPRKGRIYKGMLVTNTRMTSDAIAYGTCAGLGLLSWDYPQEKSLRGWIDSTGLHPVTSLTSLSVKSKRQLLERGVVLCRELTGSPGILAEIGLSKQNIDDVIDEAYVICETVTAED
ncbi:MAG: ATPase [Blastocatellia bacterium]|nr:ATPase [Blastocatellia bacterium]